VGLKLISLKYEFISNPQASHSYQIFKTFEDNGQANKNHEETLIKKGQFLKN